MESSQKEQKILPLQYNFYSHVHRFMRQFLSNFESQVARCDFRLQKQRDSLKGEFGKFKELLDAHAAHEDKVYHPMLKKEAHDVLEEADRQHDELESKVEGLSLLFSRIEKAEKDHEKNALGYKFYIDYTVFQSEYIKHLAYEERTMMPTLNKIHGEEKMREVTYSTYDHMTPEQFVDMVERIFPYVNAYEKTVFLKDLKDCQPKKFEKAWPAISVKLDESELKIISKDLGIERGFDPRLFGDSGKESMGDAAFASKGSEHKL